jgi:hypothetical protein
MAKTSDENGRIPPAATAGFNTRDGHAARRSDKFENTDVSTFGCLPAAAQKSNPSNGPCVPYGPSSGSWSKSGRATTKPKG